MTHAASSAIVARGTRIGSDSSASFTTISVFNARAGSVSSPVVSLGLATAPGDVPSGKKYVVTNTAETVDLGAQQDGETPWLTDSSTKWTKISFVAPDTFSSFAITAITHANPGVFTVPHHNFTVGTLVNCSEIRGMYNDGSGGAAVNFPVVYPWKTQLNSILFRIRGVSGNNVTLEDMTGNVVDTSGLTSAAYEVSSGVMGNVVQYKVKAGSGSPDRAPCCTLTQLAAATNLKFQLTGFDLGTDLFELSINDVIANGSAFPWPRTTCTIMSIAKTNPVQITVSGDVTATMAAGEVVWVNGVNGMVEINSHHSRGMANDLSSWQAGHGQMYAVASASVSSGNTILTLNYASASNPSLIGTAVDATGYSAYTTGGTIQTCPRRGWRQTRSGPNQCRWTISGRPKRTTDGKFHNFLWIDAYVNAYGPTGPFEIEARVKHHNTYGPAVNLGNPGGTNLFQAFHFTAKLLNGASTIASWGDTSDPAAFIVPSSSFRTNDHSIVGSVTSGNESYKWVETFSHGAWAVAGNNVPTGLSKSTPYYFNWAGETGTHYLFRLTIGRTFSGVGWTGFGAVNKPTWAANTAYRTYGALGSDSVQSGNYGLWCVTAGTSGSSPPTPPAPGSPMGTVVRDGTVVWKTITASWSDQGSGTITFYPILVCHHALAVHLCNRVDNKPIWIGTGSRPYILAAQDFTYLTKKSRATVPYMASAPSFTARYKSPGYIPADNNLGLRRFDYNNIDAGGDDPGDTRIGMICADVLFYLYNQLDAGCLLQAEGFGLSENSWWIGYSDERDGMPARFRVPSFNYPGPYTIAYANLAPNNPGLASAHPGLGNPTVPSPGLAQQGYWDTSNIFSVSYGIGLQMRYGEIGDATHFPCAAEAMGLLTGEERWLDMGVDVAAHFSNIISVYNNKQLSPILNDKLYFNLWGVPGYNSGQPRDIAWKQRTASLVFHTLGTDHPLYGYFKDNMTDQGNYLHDWYRAQVGQPWYALGGWNPANYLTYFQYHYLAWAYGLDGWKNEFPGIADHMTNYFAKNVVNVFSSDYGGSEDYLGVNISPAPYSFPKDIEPPRSFASIAALYAYYGTVTGGWVSPNGFTSPPNGIGDYGGAWNAPAAAPSVSSVPGGSLPARTYYVRTAYAQMTTLGQTGASPEVSISVPANQCLKVTSPPAQAGIAYWQVFVGTSPNAATNQIVTPSLYGNLILPLGTDWTEPASGLVKGAAYLPQGQKLTASHMAYSESIAGGTSSMESMNTHHEYGYLLSWDATSYSVAHAFSMILFKLAGKTDAINVYNRAMNKINARGGLYFTGYPVWAIEPPP